MTINQMFGSSPNNEAETVTEVLPDGYKKTELGIIPTEWYVESIGNLVSITTGSKNTQDRIENGAYPFFVRSQTVERINTYSFDGEGVLTAGDGVGTGKIFHYINGKFDFHQRVYLMYNFGEKLDGFFFYKFFSNNFYDRIMSMTAKSSVDSVRREMIADMKMLVPTRHEQTAIANALSDVDALIQELEKLIAKKQAIKTATMQQLLTGRTRLPAFAYEKSAHHPDGRKKGYKPSELGEIPEDWEVKTLSEISTMHGRIGWQGLKQEEFTFNDSQPFLITGMNFKDGKIRWNEVYHIAEDRYQMDKNIQLNIGDILMTKDGTIGKLLFVDHIPSPGKATLNSHLLVFRPKASTFFPSFLYYLMKTEVLDKHIEIHKSGSTFFGITQAAISKLKVCLPPLNEQISIAEVFTDIDDEIEFLDQRLAKTRQIKQGMMQELLTGKTRLVKPVGTA